jgi:hypothetical protein
MWPDQPFAAESPTKGFVIIMSAATIFKTLIDVVDGPNGQTGLYATILWRGVPWLAVGRRQGETAESYQPIRLVRPRLFRFETRNPPHRGEDYFLACEVPKAVLDGRASLEETKKFEIVEVPEVEIQIPMTR